MRLHRFNVTQPLGEDVVIDSVLLLKQWFKVFRYKKGDFVILFNGNGFDYKYSIDSLTSSQCFLKVTDSHPVYVPAKKVYLFISVIKKNLFEIVAEKATECGVTDIVPTVCDRTEKKNLDIKRLESIIKEASEQSLRGDVPTLHDVIDLKDIERLLKKQGVHTSATYVATIFGNEFSEVLLAKEGSKNDASPVAFLVGPEGGWSNDEETMFVEHSFVLVSLGKTVLRAETAGVVTSYLLTLL